MPPNDVRHEVAAGGLLDAAWYLAANPDVAQAGLDPLDHFVRFGAAEGRAPNAWFDPDWYRRQCADAGPGGLDALLHYQRAGDRQGLRPMPLFDPAWHRAAYGLPPDASALGHFLALRTSGRCLPCAHLYAVPHLAPYRDDVAHGRDPFEHYLRDVAADRREAFPDPAVLADTGLIDPNFYLIHGSDVYDAGASPIEHFCRFGWHEGRMPNAYFDVTWYCLTNPTVARLGINPLVHYVLEGEAAGRRPVPYFDPAWYRRTYDVPPEQPALAHYLAHRRSQTVSPTPQFDVAWFMARHGDTVGPNRDPFAYYLQAGTLQGMDPSPGFDAASYRQRHIGRPSRAFPHLVSPERHNPLVHYLRAEYR